jgi:hypothetical protein
MMSCKFEIVYVFSNKNESMRTSIHSNFWIYKAYIQNVKEDSWNYHNTVHARLILTPSFSLRFPS